MSETFVARRRRFPMWVIHTNVSGKAYEKVFNDVGMLFFVMFFAHSFAESLSLCPSMIFEVPPPF